METRQHESGRGREAERAGGGEEGTRHELADASYISLETFRRDGSGVETPVWHAALEGKLYVFTDGTSYKVKRLRRDARIRVAPCNVVGKVHGRWHEGRGRVVTDAALEKRAYAALSAKYGWQMTAVDLISRLAGRIGRRAILELVV